MYPGIECRFAFFKPVRMRLQFRGAGEVVISQYTVATIVQRNRGWQAETEEKPQAALLTLVLGLNVLI